MFSTLIFVVGLNLSGILNFIRVRFMPCLLPGNEFLPHLLSFSRFTRANPIEASKDNAIS